MQCNKELVRRKMNNNKLEQLNRFVTREFCNRACSTQYRRENKPSGPSMGELMQGFIISRWSQ